MKKLFGLLLLLVAIGWALWFTLPGDSAPAEASLNIQEMLGGDDGKQFRQVNGPRQFHFPADHGPHPEFKSEWWYTTGNLADASGHGYGFELTFFRQALGPRSDARRASAWAAQNGFMAHLAVTDVAGQRFFNAERLSRDSLGLAGSRLQGSQVDVWLEDWSFHELSANEFKLVGRDASRGFGVELTMHSQKPPALEGQAGLSRKGPDPAQSSYYYSLTRMQSTGRIWLDGKERAVTGLSWVDREWSSQSLGKELAGWDWFALQMEDGADLMAYILRGKDKSSSPFSGANLIDAYGAGQWMDNHQISVDVTGHWTSPRGQVEYPSGWILKTSRRRFQITPLVADQELTGSARYWEGAVSVVDLDTRTRGAGYVELVGYGEK